MTIVFEDYLFLSENLLQILEHDSLNWMNNHPEGVQPLTDQLLTLFLRVSDVVHDVADDVVVEGEGGLGFVLRKNIFYDAFQGFMQT